MVRLYGIIKDASVPASRKPARLMTFTVYIYSYVMVTFNFLHSLCLFYFLKSIYRQKMFIVIADLVYKHFFKKGSSEKL